MDTIVEQESDLAIQPNEDDIVALRQLHARLSEAEPESVAFAGGGPAALPASARRALRLAVDYLARNLAVAIEPYSQLLTTQRVADLLKVSRPTVVELLRQGLIDHTETPGGHRRVRLSDVVAFQERSLASAEDAGTAGAGNSSVPETLPGTGVSV